MVNVCCFQEVRLRGVGCRILEMRGMGSKLWWFGNCNVDVAVVV